MTLRIGQDRRGRWWVTNDHYLARAEGPNRYVEQVDVADKIDELRAMSRHAVPVAIWPACPPSLPFSFTRICVEVDGTWCALFERVDGRFACVNVDYLKAVTADGGGPLEQWDIVQLGGPLAPLRFVWNGDVAGYVMPLAAREAKP